MEDSGEYNQEQHVHDNTEQGKCIEFEGSHAAGTQLTTKIPLVTAPEEVTKCSSAPSLLVLSDHSYQNQCPTGLKNVWSAVHFM